MHCSRGPGALQAKPSGATGPRGETARDPSPCSCGAEKVWLSSEAMKFALAILAYLVIVVVLGWGILSAVKGNFWVLIAGFVAYVVAFGRIGCLPKNSH